MHRILVLLVILLVTFNMSYGSDHIFHFQQADTTDLFYSVESASPQVHNLMVKGGKVYKNDHRLSRDEVIRILNAYPADQAKYLKGDKLRVSGNTLLTLGIITSAGGMVLMVTGIKTTYNPGENPYTPTYYLGTGVLVLGEAMIIGGIVTGIIGKNKVKNTIDGYSGSQNLGYYKPPKTFSIGPTANGIGFRLNF